jgi:hypothetical protein
MEINLTNSGSLTLTISSIQITGANAADYTQTNTCGGVVSPGQTCTVSVTFNPGTTGVKSANVTITDNAFDSPQSVSLIGAGVRPNATLNPTALTFPAQLVFTSSQVQSVTLSNISAGTLFIDSLVVAGQFAQTNNCGDSLSAGASCSINVSFQPLNRGTLTGSITITDNAPNSPQTVSLTGTGTFIQLIPTSINFGTQPIHTTSVGHKIAVTNKGSVAVAVSSIAIVGQNAGDFAQTNTCGSSIASGATCTITVTFTPTVRGNRTANVSITDNGGGSPQKVSLQGVGT